MQRINFDKLRTRKARPKAAPRRKLRAAAINAKLRRGGDSPLRIAQEVTFEISPGDLRGAIVLYARRSFTLTLLDRRYLFDVLRREARKKLAIIQMRSHKCVLSLKRVKRFTGETSSSHEPT